jgi:hypothetical protein
LSRACLGKKDRFIYKWRKKWRRSILRENTEVEMSLNQKESLVFRFFAPQEGASCGSSVQFPAEKTPFFLDVSFVCPEPVLVNVRV